MLRTIVVWGVIVAGSVCGSQPLQASSLDWRESYVQMQLNAQAALLFDTSALPGILGERSSQRPVRLSVITSPPLTAEPLTGAEDQVPVWTLPESGTLILLGLGLAGIASLMRKKKS
ncbi:MAG TPA: PEP-CTERM sorting domain-containing protein [Blastocatellia bacterium]|nr:PEP-CTERM sorting domain-containing protein [Blastocatellia bacterium]